MKLLEEKNFQLTEKDALSIYAKMMHTLDSSEFVSFLSEDFFCFFSIRKRMVNWFEACKEYRFTCIWKNFLVLFLDLISIEKKYSDA